MQRTGALVADADRGDVVQPGHGDWVELLTRVPLPNSPSALSPQHATVWSASKAHALIPPALTATAPVRPWTATGVERLVFVPSPSWPH